MLLLQLPRRAMLAASLALIMICILVRSWEFSLPSGTFTTLPQFRTENRSDALMWGSVLAQLVRDEAFTERLRRALSGPAAALLAVGVVAVLLVVQGDAARRTIVAAALPLLVAHTVVRPSGWAGRVLELKPMRFVGRLSHSSISGRCSFCCRSGVRWPDSSSFRSRSSRPRCSRWQATGSWKSR